MNREWSEHNKTMQLLLKKKETFPQGIDKLLQLRRELMDQILRFKEELSADDFCAMPFKNANGYHSKTVAYSLWHIFRIEDIVVHTLMAGDEQVFFQRDFQNRIHAPIITTGNELMQDEISAFSKQLNIDALYEYMIAVDKATTQLLLSLSFSDLKEKVSEQRKQSLQRLAVVSSADSANWLIDYWCGRDIRGLIQMPLSRHWIMHIEACIRIQNKLPQSK